MNIDDDKNDCVESIVKTLKQTSTWRKSLALRWPDDPRNIRAGDKLDKLAAEAASLTDAQFEDLKPYHACEITWRNALHMTTRQVGFHHRAGDLDHFIKVLVQNLSSLSSVAA
jgi:hypothetical protein